MIIRSAVECGTCNQIITVRIGMGQGIRQEHTIKCPNCGEPISFGMTVNYQELSTNVFSIENCSVVDLPGYGPNPVINVDASFVIPNDMANSDGTFHRLKQMATMVKAAEKFGPIPAEKFDSNAPRKPIEDYQEEWRSLKRAISLSTRGNYDLAAKILDDAVDAYYRSDPPKDIMHWLFNFVLKISGRKYTYLFNNIGSEIRNIYAASNFEPFIKNDYQASAQHRYNRYIEQISDYFSKYSQFSQVHSYAALDIPPPAGSVSTSLQFDAVKSFYGDAFEIFAGSVDLLAILNNLKQGRNFDEFQRMTLAEYRKLDNANKFDAFAQNAAFSALCEEKDNQLRNASHHKGFMFNDIEQSIAYRTGKGGSGPEFKITYTEYIYRSTNLLLQTCVLFAVELTLCARYGIKLPFQKK